MNKLFLVIGLLPVTAFSADYTHCIDYVNKSRMQFQSLFKLNSQGKIDVSGIHRDALHLQNGDVHIFKYKTMFGGTGSYTVKTADNRPLEIREEIESSDGRKETLNQVAFKEKNGVCYPEKMTGETHFSGPFDIKLCRDLAEFLSNNPEAKKCGQCGNDQTNKAIINILGKYPEVTKNKIYGGQSSPDDPVWEKVVEMTNRPLSQALKTIRECDDKPGLGGALADKRIWIKTPAGNKMPAETKNSSAN